MSEDAGKKSGISWLAMSLMSLMIVAAAGAAYLAGLAAGLCPKPVDFSRQWVLEKRFEPRHSSEQTDALYVGWQRAVARLLHDPKN